MFDDQSVMAEPAEDRSGMAGTDSQQPSGRVNGQGGVLGEERVDLPSDVSEPMTRKKVVAAVSELALQRGHQGAAEIEKFGGGAGVIKWL
jgi:hypothetical protein